MENHKVGVPEYLCLITFSDSYHFIFITAVNTCVTHGNYSNSNNHIQDCLLKTSQYRLNRYQIPSYSKCMLSSDKYLNL